MKSDQPIQYKKGWVEFYKLKFAVSPDVLIPRPETELLVDEVLKFVRENPNTQLTVLDLGTGAGNIAISLAKNNPNIKIIASEVSEKALEMAKKNAKFHQVEDKIEFVLSDLLSAFLSCHSESNEGYNTYSSPKAQNDIKVCPDIIVTNLPYIPGYRIPYLDSSVKDFEPHVALDGGSDGFDLYRKLFESIKEKGWTPKLIVGEIDYTQADVAQDESKKYFPTSQVEVKLDLYHKQRILLIK